MHKTPHRPFRILKKNTAGIYDLMPGDVALGQAGEQLKTLLGSCVAVILTDPRRTVAAMCHIVHVGQPNAANQHNTAYGVASVRRDWLDVAKTLEVSALRKAFRVVLPAAAPTILTGMRISMGIAWLVIVAAEMLVGGTGIGYFVWNEWNNLSLTNVIFAILMIGVVGMMLDLIFGGLARLVAYRE